MFEQQINVIKFYQNRLDIECNLLMPYNHIKLNILFGFRPSNRQFKMRNLFRLKIEFRNYFCQTSERVRKEEIENEWMGNCCQKLGFNDENHEF